MAVEPGGYCRGVGATQTLTLPPVKFGRKEPRDTAVPGRCGTEAGPVKRLYRCRHMRRDESISSCVETDK